HCRGYWDVANVRCRVADGRKIFRIVIRHIRDKRNNNPSTINDVGAARRGCPISPPDRPISPRKSAFFATWVCIVGALPATPVRNDVAEMRIYVVNNAERVAYISQCRCVKAKYFSPR
ncbi:MAG: hypothetical protein FWH22_07720, partial [Fibromonadales bacterium]|nr:hypothetical protein [Fibromonadales bacterium]